MDIIKPSSKFEGADRENMIIGGLLKGNIVVEQNEMMENNQLNGKIEGVEKENMNSLKQPIQEESLKGIRDNNMPSTNTEGVGEEKMKQPNPEELLKGGIQQGKIEKMVGNKRNFVKLADIHPYNYKWNLQARVQQKNNVHYWQSKKKLKLLLIDDEGTRMEKCIYNKDVDKFENKIHEGKVYSFVGVHAQMSQSEYKLADQRFECLLTKDTIIEEEDEHNIPSHSFEFKSLDKLAPFVGRKSVLTDIIVVVRDASPIYYRRFDGANIAKKDVIMVDKTLNHKRLIVSGSLAIADEDEWEIASTCGTVIVATTLLVNNYEGSEFLCTTINSILMFEPSVIDVDEFREWVYHVRGRDLWYMSCIVCHTKLVEGEDAKYQCRKCNSGYSDGRLRFIFKLEIMDHTVDRHLTIFESIGENLLGCTAKSLNEMRNQDNYDDILMELLKSITWVKYIFFFSVGEKGCDDVSLLYVKRADH